MTTKNTADKPAHKLSWPVTQRLTEYLIILEELAERNARLVSSRELARLYGNTASQVRQDIFHLQNSKRAGRGYNVDELQETIRDNLGLNNIHSVAVIGCGRLGTTLALHVPLINYGMRLAAAFDVNPRLIGQRLGQIEIFDAEQIVPVCRERKVTLAALSVPKHAAQASTDRLVEAGVRGILNYTRVRLRVPDTVHIQNRQIICSFMQLCSTVNGDGDDTTA